MDVDCSDFSISCICPTAPQPIDIQCSVTPNAALTVYSYACGVIIGDGPQDTLVCDVDGVPREPCKFPVLYMTFP